MTIVVSLQMVQVSLMDERRVSENPNAAREFSIAITAVEDAIMRTNRGFAIENGTFKTADVEELLRVEGPLQDG